MTFSGNIPISLATAKVFQGFVGSSGIFGLVKYQNKLKPERMESCSIGAIPKIPDQSGICYGALTKGEGGGMLREIKLQQLLSLATINFLGHAWRSYSLPDVAGEVKSEDKFSQEKSKSVDNR